MKNIKKILISLVAVSLSIVLGAGTGQLIQGHALDRDSSREIGGGFVHLKKS